MMSQRKRWKSEHKKKTNQQSKWQNERAIERKLGIIRCTFHEFPIAIHTHTHERSRSSLKLVFLPLIVTDLHWFARFFFLSVDGIDTTFRPNDQPIDRATNFNPVQYLPNRLCWYNVRHRHLQSLSSPDNFPFGSSFSFHKFLIGFLSIYPFPMSFVFVYASHFIDAASFLMRTSALCKQTRIHTHTQNPMQRDYRKFN